MLIYLIIAVTGRPACQGPRTLSGGIFWGVLFYSGERDLWGWKCYMIVKYCMCELEFEMCRNTKVDPFWG